MRRTGRGVIDRLLAVVARLAAGGLFHTTEVEGFERIPKDRPVVLVANHFNGLVDAVVLVAALGRLPRFLAKATLWKVVPARPLLWLAGLIPVHRRVDDGAGEANMSAFAAADRALRGRGTVAIFPEGITHDQPGLAPLRTGAARIALGAAARGVSDVVLIPVGIAFEDKIALRSRVVVRAGRPLDVDRDVRELLPAGSIVSDDDHTAVRVVTDEMAARLRDVSPDFETFLEGSALALAAEVALRGELSRPREPVPLARREELAARLGDLPATSAPIFGLCAVYLLDRVFVLVSEWYGWHAVVARRAQLEEVMADRAELVADVRRFAADESTALEAATPGAG